MKLPDHEIKKIAIFRALQLGDMLCIIPAMRALRYAYPSAHITLLGLPWGKSFTERFSSYFDDFIHFPGFPGLPEQPFNAKETVDFLAGIQGKFDLLLQMQGNGTVINPIMELFGASYTGGFYTLGDFAGNQDYYMPYPNFGPEPERHLLLMEHLGITAHGNDLEFPLTEKDYADFEKLQLPIEPGKYVCIHPGSRGSWRQWPTAHFAALADYCAEQGYKVVITGTKEEAPIINEVMSHMKHPAIDTAGITTLGAVGVLIKNARALVSNCTGVSHMAAAFKTPSIVISMDGEPERWGPINKNIHYTINWLEEPGFDYVYSKTVELLQQQG
ncbi:glycosyltransferase family 9 protein [Mucilaginibacter sp. Bleaf8]|uniref:glycosyltransferase family 9 protein n=1 Tax=Mucilaginibacter sp. Bleaf8 TaxID=2834430 RepID=UPI001BCBE1EA|nr:glycosyltransferase family 9 protein [Mucilaginibacter sp. Bleaf8]MBS7564558.1 glycosyltransferase family 9 protein [Mucilaginibacter sp. Bleaf8]